MFQMTMPVTFAVIVVLLGLVVLGFFLAIRVFGERSRNSGNGEPHAKPPTDTR